MKQATALKQDEASVTQLPAAAVTAEVEISGEERLELLTALDQRLPLSNLETHRIVQALADKLSAGWVDWPNSVKTSDLTFGVTLRLSRAELGFLDRTLEAMMAGTTLARGRLILAVHGRVTALLAGEAK